MRMASCFMYLELSSAEHLVGAGEPWVGRQGQRDDCMPGHPKHTRLLPIRYHWRTLGFPTSHPLLMRPRAAPGWCRSLGGEGPCNLGKGFPVCFPALVGPGASGKQVPSTFCRRPLFSGPSRERWKLPTLPCVARQLFCRPTADGFRWVHRGRGRVCSVLIP